MWSSNNLIPHFVDNSLVMSTEKLSFYQKGLAFFYLPYFYSSMNINWNFISLSYFFQSVRKMNLLSHQYFEVWENVVTVFLFFFTFIT